MCYKLAIGDLFCFLIRIPSKAQKGAASVAAPFCLVNDKWIMT